MDNADGSREKSFWQRLKSLLRGTPDTTKELEYEILELLEDGEEQGLISSHEEQLINSIFNFRATVASEIMTPAAEIVLADINNSILETAYLISEKGYTRIPIFSGSHDNIVGILHAKDLLKIVSRELNESIEEYLNQPMVIPKTSQT
ncbi:MAG: CBS domain-containing protein, partial [Candidatus Electrothrix sp. AR3]|nr:CBS domain-containing protein [Candidatus Electrothrix sp. AR3]